MTVLREIAARFGIEFDSKALDRGSQSIDTTVNHLRALGDIVAGSAIVVGIRQFATAFEQEASRIVDASSSLGLSAREYQQLAYVFEQGGVGAERFDESFGRLQARIADAAAGAGDARAVFARLGVQVTDATGAVRPASAVMEEVAQGLASIDNPAQRTAAAVDLFGSSGRRLLALFQSGGAGIATLRNEFVSLGAGINDDAIKAGDAFGDELTRLRTVLSSLRSVLALQLLPTLRVFSEGVRSALRWVTQWRGAAGAARVVVIALAADIAGRLLPALLSLARYAVSLAPTIAAFAAFALVVEDLFVLFEGGDSLIGEWLDAFGGAGTAAQWVNDLREGMQALIEVASFVPEVVGGAFDTIVSGARSAIRALLFVLEPATRALASVMRATGAEGAASAITGSMGVLRELGVEPAQAPERRFVSDTVLAQRTARVALPMQAAAGATSTTTINAPITINGVQDPQAVGAVVRRELDARERRARARIDASSPRAERP